MVVRFIINFCFLFVIGLIIYIIKRKIVRVGYIEVYSLVWFILITGSQLAGRDYLIALPTLFVFYIAWAFFLIPSFFIYNTDRINKDYSCSTVRKRVRFLIFFLILISLISNILSFYKLFGHVNFFKYGLIGLRIQGRGLLDEQSTVFYQIFSKCYFIYIPLAMISYSNRFISKGSLIFCCFFGLITSILTLTRAPILAWAITVITSMIVCFKFTKKELYTTVILLIAPIVTVTLFISGNYEELVSVFKLYIFGGVKAYEVILNNQYTDKTFYDISIYSIDFFNYTLKKMNLIERYPSLIREYTYSPNTNVYTYLDAATLDFGVLGVLLSALSFGTIAAYFHAKANSTKDVLYLSYYCFVNYAIAISFMNNELIRVNGFILLAELLIVRMIIRQASFKTRPALLYL